MLLSTNLKNSVRRFYTDVNSSPLNLSMRKSHVDDADDRIRSIDPISGNFYPVTSSITLVNEANKSTD